MSKTSSTFDRRRPISTSSGQLRSSTDDPTDLLTFLGVAQRLNVRFLPITWQELKGPLGRGGTSKISQASVDSETSFAFKRVSDEEKHYETEDRIFRLLINELIVLQHDGLGSYIPQLQGICWDITPGERIDNTEGGATNLISDDKVWPVLVFEATRYGDLQSFLMSSEGKSMSATERLELCLSIGETIAKMQDYNIVHGDIKPQNILVFRERDSYVAKVIDFGYSTQFIAEDEFIIVPKSWPWYAPEHSEYDSFRPSQARKMDIFSLGMLCIWVIFERYFSGVAPLPSEACWAERYFRDAGGSDRSKKILNDLKRDDKLVTLASQLVAVETELTDEAQQGLTEYFNKSLPTDPDLRAHKLGDLLECLLGSENYGFFREVQFFKSLTPFEMTDCHFNIMNSIASLYQADYRVRWIIRRCLENQVLQSKEANMDHNLAFQLSLCFKIGFGGYNDDRKAQEMLRRSCRPAEQFYAAIDRMKEIGLTEFRVAAGKLYRSLHDRGLLSEMQFIDQCREHGKLQEASQALKQELEVIEYFVGPHSPLWLFHARKLVHLYRAQGLLRESSDLSRQVKNEEVALQHQQEVEDLEVKIQKTTIRESELNKSYEAIKKTDLYSSARNGGRWDDAIELGLQRIERRRPLTSEEQFSILTKMHDMSLTYPAEVEPKDTVWEEAAEQVMDFLKQSADNLDPAQLPFIRSLALTSKVRGDWKSAQALEAHVVDTLRDVFGLDHPDAVISMIDLAKTYQHLAWRTEALELFMELTDKLRRDLGDEDEITLESMDVLALAYRLQGRPQEAEEWEKYVTETRERALSSGTAQEPATATRSTLVQASTCQAEDTPTSEDKPDFALIMVPNCVLPEGWKRYQTEEGRSYYVDIETQTSTWEKPDPAHALYLVPAGWDYRKKDNGQIYWVDHNTRTTSRDCPDYIPKGWEAQEDETGQRYWIDNIRKIATDQKPFSLPPGWEARTDHLGREYYIDHGTKTKKWNIPKSMDFFEQLPYGWVRRTDNRGRSYWVDGDPIPQDLARERLPDIDMDALKAGPPPGVKLAKDRFRR